MPSAEGLRRYINSIPDSRVALQIINVLNRVLPSDIITDTAITAKAGGGQSSATPLNTRASFHAVTTVATAADSVLLPTPKVGDVHVVKNSAANSMQVFADGLGTIDSIATATGFPHPAGEAVIYWCQVGGNYLTLGGSAANQIFASITGSAATFPVTGLAAAQGGSVTLTGGASSTSGNAGGAAGLLGGAGGATGAGGAVTATGAAGGATSGAGGAVTLAGGAGTAGNSAGGAANFTSGAGQGSAASGVVTIASGIGGATGASGAINLTSGAGGATSGVSGAITIATGTTTSGASGAVTIGSGNATGGVPGTTTVNAGAAQTAATAGGAIAITGGAGNTSGAGGAVTITSGAAGATGVAGAIALTVGAATAGNGSAITLTGGNGAGGTASGGNVNLVAGTAVSTGIPGEVQVNGDSSLMTINVALTATDATRTVFVATRACRLKAVKEVHSTASSSGTLQLEKCTGTTAPGSGTSLLTGTVSLAGTANTVLSGTPSSTVATITLAAGDRISIVIAGTMTNLVGGFVSITLAPA